MLGAVAGALAAPSVFLDPTMMQPILIYAFAAAVLGGIDSPVGAVVGGLALGVLLNLLSWGSQYSMFDWFTEELRLPMALAIILGVLLIKPSGPVRAHRGEEGMRQPAVCVVPLAAFAALAVAAYVLPAFVSDFRAQQFAYVWIYLIAIVGLNVLTGYTGQISLGHGAFMAVGGFTTAILMSDYGVKDIWTIPIAGARRGHRRLPVRLPCPATVGSLPGARDVRGGGGHTGVDQALRGLHGRRAGDQPVRARRS